MRVEGNQGREEVYLERSVWLLNKRPPANQTSRQALFRLLFRELTLQKQIPSHSLQ